MLFLICHTDHVSATHQTFHLLIQIPFTPSIICWAKCCLWCSGKTVEMFTQDVVSHQRGMILLHWKNRCGVSSTVLLQNGQVWSCISTCRLFKFALVGNLSRSNLQTKTAALDGIRSFHNCTKSATSSIIVQNPQPRNTNHRKEGCTKRKNNGHKI